MKLPLCCWFNPNWEFWISEDGLPVNDCWGCFDVSIIKQNRFLNIWLGVLPGHNFGWKAATWFDWGLFTWPMMKFNNKLYNL